MIAWLRALNRRMSLKGRVALWSLVAVPLLIFTMALAAQAVLVAALKNSVDRTLTDRATGIVFVVERARPMPADLDQIVEQLTERQSAVPQMVRVTDPNGIVLASFGEIPEAIELALNSQLYRPVPDEGRFRTISVRDQSALRVYTVPAMNEAGERIALVQTADSFASLGEAQTRLWWFTGAIGAGGSLVTVLTGFWILRRGFGPLDRILDHVQEVETANLSAGLPDEPRPPELAKLAHSLNSMWERLNSQFDARQRFVASISHDLRTPLTALRGQLDVLLLDPETASETRDSIRRMQSETARLIRMSNNLLMDAQLQTVPRLRPEPLNLRELLEDAILEMRVLAGGVGLELEAPTDVAVYGDYDLLKQAFVNLIDNALKYTPEGGTVNVRLRVDGGDAVAEFADTGPGMPPEQAVRLTGSLGGHSNGAGPASPIESGATGLGLSIVHRIATLHGASIAVSSGRKGTRINFKVPAIVSVMDPAMANE